MNVLDCNPGDEIFEWLDHTTQRRLFFNATYLRWWAYKNLEKTEALRAPLDGDLLEHIKDHGIEEWKVERLCEPYIDEPALGVLLEDGTTILIDGNHRLIRWHRDGKREFNLVRIPVGEWERGVVQGFPAGFILGK